MKQTTKAMFNRFKKEFNRLIPILGIAGYRFDFEHRELEDSLARLCVNQMGHVATVTYGLDNDGLTATPEENARHEAIHALLYKLVYLGEERYTGSSEMADEAERLVRILERIIT